MEDIFCNPQVRKRLIFYVILCSSLHQRMIIIMRKIKSFMGIIQKSSWISYEMNLVWLRINCPKIQNVMMIIKLTMSSLTLQLNTWQSFAHQYFIFICIMKIRYIISCFGHLTIMVILRSNAVKSLIYQKRQLIGFIGNIMLPELKWKLQLIGQVGMCK